MEYAFIIVLAAIAILAAGAVSVRRHYRNLDAVLAPQVRQQGLEYLGSRPAGMFRWGPFNAVEFKVGVPQARVLGVSGQYWTYRIVRVRTAEGQEHEVWVKLFYAAFQLHEIEWKPDLRTLSEMQEHPPEESTLR